MHKRIAGAAVIWICVIAASPLASDQGGSEPSHPRDGSVRMRTHETWRLGANDDLLIALPTDVKIGPDGNIYVLDLKMLDIKVISPAGAHVRTIGREGEGPGEFRRPNGIAFLPDATLGVAQLSPGKLIGLHLDGKAAHDMRPAAVVGNAGTIVLTGVYSGGGNLVLSGYEVVTDEKKQEMQRVFFVRRYASDGTPGQTYFTSTSRLVFGAETIIHESDVDTPVSRIAVDSSGRVYIAEGRESYDISVYRPDGGLERTVGRKFESLKRNGLGKSLARNVLAASYRRIPGVKIEVSELEADIQRIRVADDGLIWVQSSRDVFEQPNGVFAGWDVFSLKGEYLRHVEIEAPGSPVFDDMILTDDGYVLMVTNLTDHWLVNAGLPSAAKYIGREGQDLEIVCYAIGLGEP